jgi:hypothetical protein
MSNWRAPNANLVTQLCVIVSEQPSQRVRCFRNYPGSILWTFVATKC